MMVTKVARTAGLFIAAGFLQIAGVFLIQSGASPWNWRELVGILAIGAAWNRHVAFGSAITDLWNGRKESP